MSSDRNVRFILLPIFLAILLATLCGCVHLLPTVVEEAADPQSPTRKIVAHEVKRFTTRPVTALEKRFDANHNGRLEPEELALFRQAQGYYQHYGNVWKYDKDKNWRLDQEEYYDASHSDQ